ncbi:molybdenum cofactor biosynthesis protein C, partial [Pseudovirgaria hyperparasitica]
SSSLSEPSLTHLDASGAAKMVSISEKPHTVRRAIAIGRIAFSNPDPASLIARNAIKKGDVLSIARIAGITAAKKTPEFIPLCHPIPLTSVVIDLDLVQPGDDAEIMYGCINVHATVECTGATGVEMEALMGVWGAVSTVYDMCKAVDKGMSISSVKVVLKEGGRSGMLVD